MGVLSDDFVFVGLFQKWCQQKNILSSRRLSDTCAEAFVVLGTQSILRGSWDARGKIHDSQNSPLTQHHLEDKAYVVVLDPNGQVLHRSVAMRDHLTDPPSHTHAKNVERRTDAQDAMT